MTNAADLEQKLHDAFSVACTRQQNPKLACQATFKVLMATKLSNQSSVWVANIAELPTAALNSLSQLANCSSLHPQYGSGSAEQATKAVAGHEVSSSTAFCPWKALASAKHL